MALAADPAADAAGTQKVAIETTTHWAAIDLDQNHVETQMRFYDSQSQAMQRVERLKDEAGYWPGVIGPDRDGHYRLSYDPDLAGAQGQAKAGTLPEPTLDRARSAPLAESEADLDQAETEAWLEDDQQERSEAGHWSNSRLTEAELERERKAGLPPDAETYDWRKELRRGGPGTEASSSSRLTQAELEAEIEAYALRAAEADWGL